LDFTVDGRHTGLRVSMPQVAPSGPPEPVARPMPAAGLPRHRLETVQLPAGTEAFAAQGCPVDVVPAAAGVTGTVSASRNPQGTLEELRRPRWQVARRVATRPGHARRAAGGRPRDAHRRLPAAQLRVWRGPDEGGCRHRGVDILHPSGVRRPRACSVRGVHMARVGQAVQPSAATSALCWLSVGPTLSACGP